MKKTMKKNLRLFLPQFMLNIRRRQIEMKQLKTWKENGCPTPSPHKLKQITITEYQKKYGYTTLVETGTFMGDMVEAQKRNFKKIISVELSIDLFEKAKRRFKKDKNITIMQGDSGKVLQRIIKDINEPIIFWLDGHYSHGITAKGDKECPIYEELDAIFSKNNLDHILLIDDARCFIGENDYPTIKELTEYIKSKNEKCQVEVKHDIIRCIVNNFGFNLQ
jgi:hypothetical protein